MKAASKDFLARSYWLAMFEDMDNAAGRLLKSGRNLEHMPRNTDADRQAHEEINALLDAVSKFNRDTADIREQLTKRHRGSP